MYNLIYEIQIISILLTNYLRLKWVKYMRVREKWETCTTQKHIINDEKDQDRHEWKSRCYKSSCCTTYIL